MGAFATLGYISFSTAESGSGGFSADGDAAPTSAAGGGGSATAIAANSTDMALGVWRGYAKNWAGAAPSRVGTAAYYYALQQIAVKFLSLRQGNVGSANGGKVAGVIVEKAKALQQLAKDQIALFEQFCATEAAVYGAGLSAGDGEMTVLENGIKLDASNKAQVANGVRAAAGYVKLVAADFRTADLGMGSLADWEAYGGYGYALKAQSAKLLNRLPTVSDARNPEIGKHYQAMAQVLGSAAAAITGNFEGVIKANKINFAIKSSGL